jgi:hypothetical protein
MCGELNLLVELKYKKLTAIVLLSLSLVTPLHRRS